MNPEHGTSIIVPCVKNNQFLIECIEHCLKLDSDIEILILTEDKDIPGQFPSNVHFFNIGNVNMSTKRNYGAKKSSGKYLAFIDSDAFPEKDWIKNGIKELENNSEIGMVGGPELSPKNEGIWESFIGVASKSYLINGSFSFRRKRSTKRYYTELTACNMIIKKDLYLELGGMDDNHYVTEDHHFSQKVREINKKLLFTPDVVVYHRNRNLFSFLIQRYVRGVTLGVILKKTIFKLTKNKENYKKVLREFRWEFLLPPIFILFLITFPIFWKIKFILEIYIVILSAYSLILLFESIKYSKNIFDLFGVWFILFFGTILPGVGGLFTLMNINPDIRKLYRNGNDI